MPDLPSLRFVFGSIPDQIVFEAGQARENVAREAARLNLSRVLLISSLRERGRAGEVAAGAPTVGHFTDVRQHVPIESAEAARSYALKLGVDGLLSVGGGSTTGTAKAIALTTGLPIIAVPTTYAGSEVTPVWGMTTAARKETGTDSRVLPASVVYDPRLLADLPKEIAVASALNAMAHCVEAYWAPRANPILSLFASSGIEALSRGLSTLDSDKEPPQERLLFGALLAGLSFAGAGSGLHHKICHALGGAFDLPHAPLHAVILPHVLNFNAAAVPDVTAQIGVALGTLDPIAGLRELYARVGAPRTLKEIGLRKDQLDAAVEVVAARLPIDNPRPVTRGGIAEILGAAFGRD
ncbi:maleylacetate reductase [Diaminobutyricibacter sp. McL0618]|uniref:maleylacetate reductase n=1 Tax=Leifsonia sp. McL0618 TaxID=3415677 RepID=UPI003CEDCAB3